MQVAESARKSLEFEEAVEEWSALAVDLDLVTQWCEGAIFPSEMVFFLASCDALSIDTIIESGRQDGYSTQYLGEYSRRRGCRIVSVDLELEAERARDCRERLSKYDIEYATGSAYGVVGRLAKDYSDGRAALIIDGPKGWPALSMAVATLPSTSIKIIAMHNLAHWLPIRPFFASFAENEPFLEEAIGPGGPCWKALRAKERAFCEQQKAARDLEISSLGVLHVTDRNRQRLAGLWRTEFGLHQPAVVRVFWHLGLYGLSTKLYGLSYKLLRR